MTKSARAVACALTTLVALTACERAGIGDPQQSMSVAVAIELAAANGGPADAFDRADRLFLRIRGTDGVRLEQVQPIAASGSDLRLPVEVRARGLRETVTLDVELRRAEAPLFRGSAPLALRVGATARVTVVLDAVAAGLALPDSVPVLTAYGDSVLLRGALVFATGDTVQVADVTWTSLDAAVVAIDGGVPVARADGAARLVGRIGAHADTVRARVFAAVHTIVVTPAITTLALGESLKLTARLLDRRGNAIPGRTVAWSSSDPSIIRVTPDGTATGVGVGSARITAHSGTVASDVVVQSRALAPSAETLGATQVTFTGARLRGTIVPGGATTRTWFEYATDPTFATSRLTADRSVAAGTDPIAIETDVTQLSPNTRYWFRIIADNGIGRSTGEPETFTTGAGTPVAVTGAATAITQTTATLSGTVTSNGAGTAWFEWGTSSDLATFAATPPSILGAGTVPIAVQHGLTGLAPGTTYYFRLVAKTAGGTVAGAIFQFRTPTLPPSSMPPAAATDSSSAVTASGATLFGTANPNGLATDVWFEVGDDDTPFVATLSTPAQALGAGSAAVAFQAAVAGLAPGTAYAYRAVARNAAGTTYGATRTFTTSTVPPAVPTVSTDSASAVGQTSASLHGTAGPAGSATTAWFIWGTDPNLTSPAATPAQAVGSGSALVPYAAALTGLAPGTTYYYRAVASSAGGTVSGVTRSFTTPTVPPAPPTVSTDSAVAITQTTASLHGTAGPAGSATTAWFVWSTDPNLTSPSATPAQAVGSGNALVPYAAALTGLAPGTTYYFRAVASSVGGTVSGAILTFTTAAAGPPPPTVVTDPAAPRVDNVVAIGRVNPNGSAATGWFEYGTDPTFATFSTTASQSLGAGTAEVLTELIIHGLQPSTTYYVRAVASNAGGTAYGVVRPFTTQPAAFATATTLAATGVTTTGATLRGQINPNGSMTNAFFEWSTDPAMATVTATPPVAAGFSSQTTSVNSVLTGLSSGQTIYYRVVGSNSAGEARGAILSFTTN